MGFPTAGYDERHEKSEFGEEIPFFYRDTGYSFLSVFFLGKEITLLIFDIIIFNLIDILTGSTLIGIICTYVVD